MDWTYAEPLACISYLLLLLPSSSQWQETLLLQLLQLLLLLLWPQDAALLAWSGSMQGLHSHWMHALTAELPDEWSSELQAVRAAA